ncbi:hypothetical protein [Metabacillus indicus]|uniref:hypothetical protein n=1 Tax=Metabacillus indicus TaxID=246786 RepID=UPI00049368CC|nr:hypothetical protein [Metabacillus indicus]KEZ50852.1 hypothetical protein AZ46_0209450 [Metabacillus indicus LMG 22858]
MIKRYLYIVSICVIFLLAGCTDSEVVFIDLYDSDPKRIQKITITNGANGERRVLHSSRQVNDFFSELEDITFNKRDIDKDEINGFLYAAAFYEKGSNNPFFTMSTNLVNDHVYEPNKDLEDLLKRHFKNGKVDQQNN